MVTMHETVGRLRKKNQKVVEKTRVAKEEKAPGNGVAMQIRWMSLRPKQDQRKQLAWTWVVWIRTLSIPTRYLTPQNHYRESTTVVEHACARCHRVEGGV